MNTATVNDALSERKKFNAPVKVPTCERTTEFCAETVVTGNTVPRPSANSDSSTSNTHSGMNVDASPPPANAPHNAPMIATRL